MLSNAEAGYSFKAQVEVYSEGDKDIESKTEKSVKDCIEEIIGNSEGDVNECKEDTYEQPPKAANDNSIEAGKDNKAYDRQNISDEKEDESDWEIEF